MRCLFLGPNAFRPSPSSSSYSSSTSSSVGHLWWHFWKWSRNVLSSPALNGCVYGFRLFRIYFVWFLFLERHLPSTHWNSLSLESSPWSHSLGRRVNSETASVKIMKIQNSIGKSVGNIPSMNEQSRIDPENMIVKWENDLPGTKKLLNIFLYQQ